MITEDVIKDIYRNYSKPIKNRDDLRLDYFLDLLKPIHKLHQENDEIIVGNLEEFSPFRRFLIRSLHAILEFDRNVAVVFRNHILFFGKEDEQLSVNFKPEEKKSFFGRLFSHND